MTDYERIESAVKMLTGEVAVLGQKVQDLSPMHPDITALKKSLLELNMSYVALKNIVMDLNSRVTKLEKEKEEDGTD